MEEVISISSEDERMNVSAGDETLDATNDQSALDDSTAAAGGGGKTGVSKLSTSSAAKSASGSNLKLQAKIEVAKKREEAKERKEREKKEKEEQRLKREAEAKRKREEEEALKKKKAEEARLKKEEEETLKKKKAEEARLKKEEEKARKEEERLKKEEEKARKEEEDRERKKKLEEIRLKREEDKRKLEELRLKREEEKEKAAQERLEKEKKRLEALSAKTEEKKRKEEEKQKEELLSVKTKKQFEAYFIKKEAASKEESALAKNSRFMSFQLKENMALAPVSRRTDCLNMNDEQRFEFICKMDRDMRLGGEDEDDDEEAPAEPYDGPTYLEEIRKNPSMIRRQVYSCRKKRSMAKGSGSSDEVKIIDVTSSLSKFKVKYLHFDSKVYRRPPYYGTWRKKSRTIRPRNPFGMDEKLIDYEIDSDDEWEDEADGESIENSEKGDQDQEELGDDEDDDGFFVPHGHLSDDELDEDERMLDPETKKAREEAKKEQYETERKRASKYLVPKCFTTLTLKADHLKPSDVEDLKHLERLRMVPIAAKVPVVILTDEFLEKQAAQKAADDAAIKLANKTAKAAAQLEALNGASPTSVSKATKNAGAKKQPSQLVQQSTGASVPTSPAPAPTTPSIINFISKMSNKKVVCKLEPVGGPSQPTVAVNTPKPTSEGAAAAAAEAKATPGTPSLPSVKPMTPALRLEPIASPIVSGAMSSPKMTPTSSSNLNTSCSTAEKRVSCFNNSSQEEEENSGKRLKLDSESKGADEVIKATTNTPANAAIVINTLFRSASCKKSLKLSSSAKKLNENSAQKKPSGGGEGTPSLKRATVLQVSKDTSSNSPVKMEVGGSGGEPSREPVKVKSLALTTSTAGAGAEPEKNKENDKQCIVVD